MSSFLIDNQDLFRFSSIEESVFYSFYDGALKTNDSARAFMIALEQSWEHYGKPGNGISFFQEEVIKTKENHKSVYSKLQFNYKGRTVFVEEYMFLGNLFGDMLEGVPTRLFKLKKLSKLVNSMEKEGHVFLFPNSKKDLEQTPFIHQATLICYKPIDSNMLGSEVTVKWLSSFDLTSNKSIRTIVKKGIEELNWEKHAVDFDLP